MGHPTHGVEFDVVWGGVFAQDSFGAISKFVDHLKLRGKSLDRLLGMVNQLTHQRIAFAVQVFGASGVHFAQAVLQSIHQQLAPLGVVQQVVLQIRVALHHPDVTQHFVEHAGRTSGTSFTPQGFQNLPRRVAQQANDDFAVGKRGVVVGNFAKSRAVLDSHRQLVERRWRVHK